MQIAPLYQGQTIPFSYEIFPPKGEMPLEDARSVLAGLAQLDPAFVSVTYSAGGTGNSENTAKIAEMGSKEYGLTTMAHLTCVDSSRDHMDTVIADMKARGVENVLALRGDLGPGRQPKDYRYAADLIPTLREAGFCVGAAAYPEGHKDCLDMEESVRWIKAKQDAGAQFLVTQLFFDNRYAYKFLDACRAARIRIPITFGIMPFMSKDQVARMVFMCGASLPAPLVKIIARYEHDPESLRKAGIEYACQQMIGLAEHGVDGLHLYSMNKPEVAAEIHRNVRAFL